MIRQIKAELQKIFTIRSTYVILGICLLITIFFAFYVEGLKQVGPVTDPNKLAGEVTGAVRVLATLIALVGLMLVTHEYRYNLISYTLTSTNNRLKVLAAKVIAASIFALGATLLFAALAPLLTDFGIHLRTLAVVHQHFPIWDLYWRSLFFGWAVTMFAVIMAFIIRSQVGTIVVYLVFPGIVESLLTLLLKAKAVYLPFTGLSYVLDSSQRVATANGAGLSYGKAAVAALVYIVIGLIVSAVLFRRRDAS